MSLGSLDIFEAKISNAYLRDMFSRGLEMRRIGDQSLDLLAICKARISNARLRGLATLDGEVSRIKRGE